MSERRVNRSIEFQKSSGKTGFDFRAGPDRETVCQSSRPGLLVGNCEWDSRTVEPKVSQAVCQLD